MFEYLTTGSAAALSHAQALDTQFDQVFGAVAKGSAAETQALTDASAIQYRYYTAFQDDRQFRVREPVAASSRRLEQLDQTEDAINAPLNTLSSLEAQEAADSAARASSSAGQALAIGISAAVLAALAGCRVRALRHLGGAPCPSAGSGPDRDAGAPERS